MRIAELEVRRYALPLDPPFRAAWDPVPRDAGRGDARDRPRRGGARGLRERRRRPARRGRAARLLAGLDPRGPRSCASCARPSTCTAGGRGPRRSRSGTSRPARSASRSGACSAGARSGCSRTRRAASWSRRRSARARVVALRDAGVRAVKLRFHHADWRDDVAVVEAVRDAVGRDVELLVDANQGWRMAGDRSPRWDVATAAQCARALEPLGVFWLEEPLPTADVDGYAALRRLTVAADRGRRDGAHGGRGARPAAARRRRRDPARRRARGRPRRLPPDRGGRRPVRADVLAAHVVERARARRQPAPRVRGLDVPVRRGPATTRRRGRPRGATGCCPRRSRSPPDGTIAPPRRSGPRRRAGPRGARAAARIG